MTHAPLVIEGLARSTSTVSTSTTDVLNRYTYCKNLRDTLYGETSLYVDKELRKLVVLKRISIPLLQQHDDNTDAVSENPLSERAVIQLLKDPLIACAPGREYVVEYKREGFFTAGDSVYVAMDFCAGGDLYDYVTSKPSRRVPEPEALSYFAQIAKGLSFLHAIGVAHRDLSLENVLLKDGCVKICDFGLSADAGHFSADKVGKFYYMAPEVTQRAVYDPKSADVWSLGVVLFIMLTGSPLFVDEDARAPTLRVLHKYGVGKILELWGLNHRLSTPTINLLANMLQVEPSRRFSAEEVAHHPILRAMSNCRALNLSVSSA
ncbi:hypothetical protein KXD40_008477 [Peronospora effusa]|uniref:Protein kinase domain-containing protein n=1 Tax=Peronospora effusa TaxID=542832 RepID=A0A3M6VEK0_9STRA|nr:hypothetical protein DD238_007050 [Peronospora effusa]RQM12252.1 hypothetical protein DD237_008236 [Peronospora effusa]UIZ24332.1 hypothetical protein KXD40_008477 [Peronospora effusa]CAI5728831.1 unnamed protein product [Peronospora effusa]